jgi:hypothetical protein
VLVTGEQMLYLYVMSTEPHLGTPWTELQRRLVYALLKPAMRLCRAFRLPLGVVEELTRMAYFEEIRLQGNASQAQTAMLMGKSLRTVGNLERQYRTDFLAPETELEHTRQVEDAFADAPLSLDDVCERVPHIDTDEVERVLDGLTSVGRVHLHGSNGDRQYVLDPTFVSLVRDDVDTQIDGLRHQLDVIVAAVRARFFDRGQPAMARTLSFVADPEDMEALGDDFVLGLRRRCIEAEEAALKRKSRGRYAVTFVLTPMNETKD